MSKKIEISMEDWQMLIDMHEKLSRVLFESVDFFQEVAYTANDQRTAKRDRHAQGQAGIHGTRTGHDLGLI